MKIYIIFLIIILYLPFHNVEGQNIFHFKDINDSSKYPVLNNEIEYGFNWNYFFGHLGEKSFIFNEFINDRIKNRNLGFNTFFRFPRPFPLFINEGYFGYKRFINKRHCIVFNHQSFGGSNNNIFYSNHDTGITDIIYQSFGLGYGYRYNHKQLEIIPQFLVVYRLFGAEAIRVGYRSPNARVFSEPIDDLMYYNSSIGFMSGIDFNYFITKKLGLGVNILFQYYPFENGRTWDWMSDTYLDNYKPNKKVLALNLKFIYRFKLL